MSLDKAKGVKSCFQSVRILPFGFNGAQISSQVYRAHLKPIEKLVLASTVLKSGPNSASSLCACQFSFFYLKLSMWEQELFSWLIMLIKIVPKVNQELGWSVECTVQPWSSRWSLLQRAYSLSREDSYKV